MFLWSQLSGFLSSFSDGMHLKTGTKMCHQKRWGRPQAAFIRGMQVPSTAIGMHKILNNVQLSQFPEAALDPPAPNHSPPALRVQRVASSICDVGCQAPARVACHHESLRDIGKTQAYIERLLGDMSEALHTPSWLPS